MLYQIEISLQPQFRDKHGEHVKHEIAELGVKGINEVKYLPIYKIEGNLSRQEAERIASRLLIDPITEQYLVIDRQEKPVKNAAKEKHISGEIWFKRGVTDTVSGSD